MSTVRIEAGDSREVLRTLADNSIDAVACDPPYSLQTINKRFAKVGRNDKTRSRSGPHQRTAAGFMNQKWDTGETAFDPAFWAEVLRVLKPGGHLIAFGGTRTYHRLASAIENAGFEIRDMLADFIAGDAGALAFLASLDDVQRAAFFKCLDESSFGGLLSWVFGSGFPKSHNVAKGIDKAAGRKLEVVPVGKPQKRMIPGNDQNAGGWEKNNGREYQPGEYVPSEEAAPWKGWGTALKPAHEPICLARKPLEGTVAANVLKYGTGALNIDGCRIPGEPWPASGELTGGASVIDYGDGLNNAGRSTSNELGRWPANVVHDGSAEVVRAFPETGAGGFPASRGAGGIGNNGHRGQADLTAQRLEGGSAARFFYSAKADAGDRLGSKHPTVKPVDLMRWLVRLITPPGGTVLDPFAGTGTTGMACMAEGFDCILVEREAEYLADIRRRIGHVTGSAEGELFAKVAE